MPDNPHIQHLDQELTAAVAHLKNEFNGIRSNRPSLELVEDLKVVYYDQPMTVKQLGSLSISPPRDILVSVWDKAAVGPVMGAIQDAQVGLSVTNDGNTIRASLSALSGERREELTKVVKKMAEAARITVRTHRDDAMKAFKTGKEKKELSEDQEFTYREQAQKRVEKANEEIESLVTAKLQAISE
jgi:ribosome recycling factor